MKVKYGITIAVTSAVLLAAVALPAFAATNQGNGQGNQSGQNDNKSEGQRVGLGMHNGVWQGQPTGSSTSMMNRWRNGTSTNSMPPGVFGTVSAVNGTTISVASRGFAQNTATTTYSVDASNATIYKNNATSTISSILVGDRVFAQGTVSGTNVTAKTVRDGMMMGGGRPGLPGGQNQVGGQNQLPIIKGNGQPVVAGTVSVISGTSLTITTSSNTSYSINAASTTVSKNGVASTISSIAAGDYVVVQGPVNGSSITASLIIDQVKATPSGNGKGNNGNGLGNGGSNGNKNGNGLALGHTGFLGSIGNFFKNLFGF